MTQLPSIQDTYFGAENLKTWDRAPKQKYYCINVKIILFIYLSASSAKLKTNLCHL